MKTRRERRTSPLLAPATLLSLASIAWTTWSLVDLLGAGLIGVTVAAGADIIWASVIVAEARNLRVASKAWTVPAFGWATLLVVAGLLAWHGIAKDSLAMAVAGPFLPLGAKAVWILALADLRDPTALTDDELHQLARMERGMAFEDAQHRLEMRRRAMGAELLMAEVATDFDIEVMRQDKTRELSRRRPLEIAAAEPEAHAVGAAPRFTTPAPPQGDASPAPHAAPHEAACLSEDDPELPEFLPLKPAPRSAAQDEAAEQRTAVPQTLPVAGPPAQERAADALRLDGLSKADAVRRLHAAEPDAPPLQLVTRLAQLGVAVDASYVRTVLARSRKQPEPGTGQYL